MVWKWYFYSPHLHQQLLDFNSSLESPWHFRKAVNCISTASLNTPCVLLVYQIVRWLLTVKSHNGATHISAAALAINCPKAVSAGDSGAVCRTIGIADTIDNPPWGGWLRDIYTAKQTCPIIPSLCLALYVIWAVDNRGYWSTHHGWSPMLFFSLNPQMIKSWEQS